LDETVCSYNQTPHSATGVAPDVIFWGGDGAIPADKEFEATIPPIPDTKKIEENRLKYVNKMNQQYNKKRHSLAQGNWVRMFHRVPATNKHSADRHLRQRQSRPLRVLAIRDKGRVLVSDGIHRAIVSGYTLTRIPDHEAQAMIQSKAGENYRTAEIKVKPLKV